MWWRRSRTRKYGVPRFRLAVLAVFENAQVGDIPLRWAAGRIPSFEGGRDDPSLDVLIVIRGHATALASLGWVVIKDIHVWKCDHQTENLSGYERGIKHGITLKQLGGIQRIVVPSLGTCKRR